MAGCGCVGECDCAKFAPGGNRADWLICIEDMGRNVDTLMGMRPYSVHLVRTRSTGPRRGQGPEVVVREWEILPVPRVGDLTGIQRIVTAGQVEAAGTVLLSEVSGRYTEDQMVGRPEGGGPLAENESVYYEIRYPGGIRRRFVASSEPSYDAVSAQWRVVLTIIRGTRDRVTGAPR